MVTDQQYWRLMKLRRTEQTLAQAAAKAAMYEKTARKYLRLRKPPSQLRKVRSYCTRKDNFATVWRELEELLEREPGLEALTLMEHLCRQYPGQFQMSQLRTLQASREALASAGGSGTRSLLSAGTSAWAPRPE
jgi:hypothetical protein